MQTSFRLHPLYDESLMSCFVGCTDWSKRSQNWLSACGHWTSRSRISIMPLM